ncbi:MAG TPA: DUF423 domain-containing protein [Gemmatimonadales bacterium]|jgi:uncharacterized membrane protein YgdD (TMEM256/DUF423 family)|nr:DUF423 domain-containing protein [Gemmatimonadales bacterium]
MTHTPSTDHRLLAIGGALAGLGVVMGAFSAHLLRDRLAPDMLEVVRLGAQYELLHGIAIVAVAGAMSHFHRARLRAACWLFIAGIVLFSGSLYALALTGNRAFGMVTPLGGLAFIAGWVMVMLGARPREKTAHKD